jgi:hypothetical protein
MTYIARKLPPKRPHVYPGDTYSFSTACGSIYITVSHDDTGYPTEVFARMGKVGGCASATLEAVARSVSVALRCDVDAAELASQYIGITCTGGGWDHGKRITSCVSAIGMALQEYIASLGIKTEGTVDEKDSRAPIPASEPAGDVSLAAGGASDTGEPSVGDSGSRGLSEWAAKRKGTGKSGDDPVVRSSGSASGELAGHQHQVDLMKRDRPR